MQTESLKKVHGASRNINAHHVSIQNVSNSLCNICPKAESDFNILLSQTRYDVKSMPSQMGAHSGAT